MSSNNLSTFQLIAFLVIGFIAFIFAAAFLFPNQFTVERSIEIDQPKDHVFEYIMYLENQYKYSEWGRMDPYMDQQHKGTDGTVGFILAWDGDESVGRGEQEIIRIQEGEQIDYELRFFEPFESTANSFKKAESIDENRTKVTWGMSGTMPRPFNLMLIFEDMEGSIGEDLQTGLKNLKTILEEDS